MEKQDERLSRRQLVEQLLGPVARSLPENEKNWLMDEAAAIEELSRGLAEFPTAEWDFAPMLRPDSGHDA